MHAGCFVASLFCFDTLGSGSGREEFGFNIKERIDDGMYDALDDRLGDGSESQCCTCCNAFPRVVSQFQLWSLSYIG